VYLIVEADGGRKGPNIAAVELTPKFLDQANRASAALIESNKRVEGTIAIEVWWEGVKWYRYQPHLYLPPDKQLWLIFNPDNSERYVFTEDAVPTAPVRHVGYDDDIEQVGPGLSMYGVFEITALVSFMTIMFRTRLQANGQFVRTKSVPLVEILGEHKPGKTNWPMLIGRKGLGSEGE